MNDWRARHASLAASKIPPLSVSPTASGAVHALRFYAHNPMRLMARNAQIRRFLQPEWLLFRGSTRSGGRLGAEASPHGNEGILKFRAGPSGRENASDSDGLLNVFVWDWAYSLQAPGVLIKNANHRLDSDLWPYWPRSEAKGDSFSSRWHWQVSQFRLVPQIGQRPRQSGWQTIFMGSERITCSRTRSASSIPSPE